MATSAARLEANRRNAQKSTGPKTPEGKAICRQNALKHGLTGACVVVPGEDVEAVSERFAQLEAEWKPMKVMALILIRRIALLSLRLDRSARQEAARITEAMRNAASDFIDARLAEVERLFAWIAAEPATNARRLRSTPEGVDRLIKGWLDLDADLVKLDVSRWGYSHWGLMENLQGRTTSEFPISREGALFKTILGQPGYLDPSEVGEMDMTERRDYAAVKLREVVAGHVADLRALLETFDMVAEARSRDEAAKRALFDTSKEAILARKYEAATERALFRTMAELRELEAEPTRPDPLDATPDPGCNNEAMGLNLRGASEVPVTRRLGRGGRLPSVGIVPGSSKRRSNRRSRGVGRRSDGLSASKNRSAAASDERGPIGLRAGPPGRGSGSIGRSLSGTPDRDEPPP